MSSGPAESHSVGLQTDVAVIFEEQTVQAGKHYCVWYGRVQRMFKLNGKKKKIEYKKPVSLLSKPKDVMLKLHYYSCSQGNTFKYDHHDDNLISLECVISTVFFTHNSSAGTYTMDNHDLTVVGDALKSCNQLGRIVGIDPRTPDMQRRHVVEAVCGRRINEHTGEVEYNLKWKDTTEPSWERESNCSCRTLIREFDASLREC